MNCKTTAKSLLFTFLTFSLYIGNAGATTIDSGNCLQDAANTAPHHIGELSCSSNDVGIANTTNIEVLQNNCLIDGTGTVTFKADFHVQSNANERYNVGIYFAVDNDSNNDGALSGTCSITTLPTTGPANPNDVCGDISNDPLVQNITVTAPCTSLNANGNLRLPYCTAWQNNDGATCSSPADAVPTNASKCKCESGADFQIPLPGAVQARATTFDGDTTAFSYHLIGPSSYDQTLPATANSEVSADFNQLPQGSYHLAQDALSGWVLVNASCSNGDVNIPQNFDGSFDIDVVPGKVVNCDFANAFPIEAISIQSSLLANTDVDESGHMTAGDILTLEYLVTNTGNVLLTNAIVTDDHEGLSEISCDSDGTLSGSATMNCTATYTLTQGDIDLGNIHDDSSVVAQANSGAISANAALDIPIAQVTLLTLAITPSSATFENIDESIGYVYEVTNGGNTAIAGPLSVTDDKNLVVCPETESLAPAASVVCTSSYLITEDDLTAGSVTNTASALLGAVASNSADATVSKLVVTPVSSGGGGGGGSKKPKPTQNSSANPPVVVTPPLASPTSELAAQGSSSGCGCNANATPLSDGNWMLMGLMLVTYLAWRRQYRQRRN